MAGSISEAGKALIVDVSGNVPGGGSFSIKIITDNVEIAKEVCRTVAKLGEATFKIAGTLGVVYGAYKLLRPIIKGAAKKAFGGERDDQEIGEPRPGSLHVLLHCLTDERYLEVLEDYESGRMKERLLEEFSLVGIKVEGLKVEIENMVEMNKTKEAINKRRKSRINKNTCEDVKNIVIDDAQNDVKKHDQKQFMKPLPRDESALFEEINSFGLLGPNARLQPRAKLVKCINDSRKIGRSINHVSILSLGPSGVGRFSTVNHLLGVKLAETVKFWSETKSTQEFTIHGSDPEYEVDELSLGLVHTPGFCDTDGSYQDACNLLSIQTFFRTHPKLSGCYPNLIFVVVKATDNRIMGENSDLGKSLRFIKQLGLVDPNKPNVVAIVTHACGIHSKNAKKWSDELERTKSRVRQIIFNDLKVFAPVVMLENAYDDCDLEVRGDFTCLPNGELQPKNLYLACAEVLKSHNDNLGLITLNSVFAASGKGHTAKSGHMIKAKIARKYMLDAEERTMVDILESADRGE